MSGGAERALLHGLAAGVAELIEAALAVDLAGGTSPAWAAVLSKAAVVPLGEDDRIAEAKREKMYRGAPISEVAACLERISARTAEASGGGGIAQADAARVRDFLPRLVAEALGRYREEACRRPAGGMFLHALASAREHKYAEHRTTRGYVLECPRCGAPRLTGFTCAYCGAHLSGKEGES